MTIQATVQMMDAKTTTGAATAINGFTYTKTYQVSGRTSAGSGAATVNIEGSMNDGVSWSVIGTITLALTATGGTDDASDSFTSHDRYAKIRANVTAISGTNAQVSAWVGY